VKELFGDALLESSAKRSQTRALEWTLSLAAHGILVAAMFVVPLYWSPIELRPSNYMQSRCCGHGCAATVGVQANDFEWSDVSGELESEHRVPVGRTELIRCFHEC
jgi:hypothetical protein